jgi:hypothetical protein
MPDSSILAVRKNIPLRWLQPPPPSAKLRVAASWPHSKSFPRSLCEHRKAISIPPSTGKGSPSLCEQEEGSPSLCKQGDKTKTTKQKPKKKTKQNENKNKNKKNMQKNEKWKMACAGCLGKPSYFSGFICESCFPRPSHHDLRTQDPLAQPLDQRRPKHDGGREAEGGGGEERRMQTDMLAMHALASVDAFPAKI